MLGTATFFVGTAYAGLTLSAEPASATTSHSAASTTLDNSLRVSLSVARDRATAMHDIYAATLETMHRHYFHDNRAVLPARALEDVFGRHAELSGTQSRWISVNTSAMSVNHEPKDDFEKQAARAIASGKPVYERVEKGFLLRAGAIPLEG